MPKIAIFDQKSWFFQSGYTCSYGRYMAGNMHLGCLRHILDAFMIYGVDLMHFWKNRKKSIFWLIFCDLRSYIYIQISWFRPIIGHMVLRPHANTLGLFPVKNAAAYRPSYLPYAMFCVLVPFCQNRVFLQSMIYKGKNSLIEYST